MSDTVGNEKGKPVVLVVDDDPDLRTLAGLQLGDAFDVVEAADGEQALALAAQHAPSVILLDMMMPGMSGEEVLVELSKEESTRDIPVIFLSAMTEVDQRVRALEEGALDYVTKPADWRELTARVGAAARVHQRHEEIRMDMSRDPVTDLPLRGSFMRRLQEEVARSARSTSPLSVLLIEIDAVEPTVDLIRRSGEVLRNTLRTADALFRYAEKQFAAILVDTDVATAYMAAERLRDATKTLRGQRVPTTISVGISEMSVGHTPQELVDRATVALFRAKESGGDQSWRADDPRRRALSPLALSEELTEREWEILSQLAQKRTEVEIARRLGISAGTVRSHKARIRRKLHVSPDVRLSEFVRTNMSGLADGLSHAGDRGRS